MTGYVRVIRHVLRLAWRADRAAVTIVVALTVLKAAAVPAAALSLRWLTNSVRASDARSLLLAAGVGALAYAVLAVVLRIQHNLQVDLVERADVALSQEILGHVAAVPTVEHLERPEYLDRLSELRRSTEGLAGICWTVLDAVTAIVSLALSVWLLFTVHPALVLLAVVAAPPLLATRYGARFLSRARQRSAADVRQEVRLHEIGTTPESAKEVSIAGSGAWLEAQAERRWAATTRALAGARAGAALVEAAGWACFAAGYVLGLGLVAYLIGRGRGSLGDLVLVISLASYLRGQLTNTVHGIGALTEGNDAVGHYRWLTRYSREHRHPGTVAPPARLREGIRLQDVEFAYPGAPTPVLRGVTVDLPAGAVVALVGVNGEGKTTLVKLLAGMYRPDRGDILVDGVALSQLDALQWRERLTGAFQDYARLQTTVDATVGAGDLPRRDDAAAVERAIEEAGATALVRGLPEGERTQLGALFDGVQLSQGGWQKLALARSLMRRAPLLAVFDEPTAALDPLAEHAFYERVSSSARSVIAANGGIVLLVSHRFSTVSMADHIIVLADGRIAEQGRHADLMRRGGRYAELYVTHARGYE
jgi:ATP-binding cassette subfamily B protein